MDFILRKCIWTAAVVAVLAPMSSLSATPVIPPKQMPAHKHHKKIKRHEQVIVLSNDDLPRDGRHYVMVPGAAPEMSAAAGSAASSPAAASTPGSKAAAAAMAPASAPVPTPAVPPAVNTVVPTAKTN